MNNKKFLWAGLTLLLLVSLFAMVQTVVAASIQSAFCGNSGPQGDSVLRVKKDAFCEQDTSWTWDIVKSADQSSLVLAPGETFTVNYDVTASAVATSDYSVNGTIYIQNIHGATVTVNDVSDSLGDITGCTVGGNPVTLPYNLPAGYIMLCGYSGSQATQPSQNVATVAYTGGTTGATANLNWTGVTPTETDECALISDTYPGGPNETVCADGQQTFTFEYSRDIMYEVCGEYTVENTASFLTNDTGATGSSTWVVDVTVPCEGGCTLTPGYWKTHSSYGPAPYDDTWSQIGEDTTFFLSGKSYYQALWVSPNGNAYWVLAHAYIAAELNFLNGADSTPDVDAAFASATTLFQTWTPLQIGSLRGNDPLRQQFLALATTLDDYNNGLIGPGHCDE